MISYFTFRRFRTRKRAAEMISDRPSKYELPKHFMFRGVPCATVAAFSFNYTTTCHLLLPGHLGTATWLHRLLTFIIWGLTTGITLRGGVLFSGRGTFNYDLMTYTVLIYACMYTKTPIACFLFRLKNPDTKTPHTCLSQPHGGSLIVYDGDLASKYCA